MITRDHLTAALRWSTQRLSGFGAVSVGAARCMPWSATIPLSAGNTRFWLKVGPRVTREYAAYTACTIPNAPVPDIEDFTETGPWLLSRHLDHDTSDAAISGNDVASTMRLLADAADLVPSMRLPRITLSTVIDGVDRGLSSSWLDSHTARLLDQTLMRSSTILRGIPPLTSPIRVGLIHGDLHPANVLPRRGRAFLVDWTDSGVGSPLWDAAMIYANFTDATVPDAMTPNTARLASGLKALADILDTDAPSDETPLSVPTPRIRKHVTNLVTTITTSVDHHDRDTGDRNPI